MTSAEDGAAGIDVRVAAKDADLAGHLLGTFGIADR
jgi:hypothetical protein